MPITSGVTKGHAKKRNPKDITSTMELLDTYRIEEDCTDLLLEERYPEG